MRRAQALPKRIVSDKVCWFFRAYSLVLALGDRGVRVVYRVPIVAHRQDETTRGRRADRLVA